jgi:hypothetical protein
MIILRLGDIPFDKNTSSVAKIICGDTNGMNGYPSEGCADRSWVYGLGWTLCLIAFLIFIVVACVELAYQIDYGIFNVRVWLLTCYFTIQYKNILKS